MEGRTPFEGAALLQPRLDPNGFFIFGAKVELEATDGTEVREANFKFSDNDYLAGIFSGDEGLTLEHPLNVPPSDRADWSVTDDARPGEPGWRPIRIGSATP